MTCNWYIGRLSAIWIGKESTAWQVASITTWIPFDTGEIKPVIESIKDTWSYWVIDENYDSKVVKNMSELSLGWVVRDDFIWDILLATLWISEAPVDNGDGTYTHKFERKNDNTPITYTAYNSNPVWDEVATNMAVDSLDIELNTGDYVKFTLNMKGKALTTPANEETPAYTDQKEFLVANAEVKFADTIWDLDSATAVKLKNIKFTINKNLMDYQAIGSTDVECIFNQQFSVSWDLEALFSDTTLRDYVLQNQKKAMRITAISSDWQSKLQFDFARLSFADWGKSTDNNNIVSQTMGFNAEFSATDWKTISAELTNSRDTQY